MADMTLSALFSKFKMANSTATVTLRNKADQKTICSTTPDSYIITDALAAANVDAWYTSKNGGNIVTDVDVSGISHTTAAKIIMQGLGPNIGRVDDYD